MKLFMVVYMCLLDLTFETCDLSQGQEDQFFSHWPWPGCPKGSFEAEIGI